MYSNRIHIIEVVCLFYYIIGIFFLLLSFYSKTLSGWSLHGKNLFIRLEKDESEKSYKLYTLKKKIDNTLIPKAYFFHFYIVGLIVNFFVLLQDFNENYNIEQNVYQILSSTSCLLQIHLFRRLLEQLFVIRTTKKSFMNICSYLLGISFYVITPISLHSDNVKRINSVNLFALIIFITGNILQYDSHVRLSKLRSKDLKEGDDLYKVPYGGFFNFVSCPHYLAEILIYFSFFIWNWNIISSLNFVFVLLGLIKNGIQTHTWYLKVLGDAYPRTRKIIFPYIL
ncbi:polyprenol reductase, putative [Hepatocystis sp. ex Piliocolobus tephrosceles]|nr:polyprenol reductase, putative [Hepatocystis sp. ex Piliocolobus tephrosceles]